jgi:hypothetical protein
MDELMRTIAGAPLKKRAVTNASVLNEAYAYAKPSSFSRGLRIDLNGVVILLISARLRSTKTGRVCTSATFARNCAEHSRISLAY